MKYTLDEQREMIRKVLLEKTKERDKLLAQKKGSYVNGRSSRIKGLIRQCAVLSEVVITLAAIPLLKSQLLDAAIDLRNHEEPFENLTDD